MAACQQALWTMQSSRRCRAAGLERGRPTVDAVIRGLYHPAFCHAISRPVSSAALVSCEEVESTPHEPPSVCTRQSHAESLWGPKPCPLRQAATALSVQR